MRGARRSLHRDCGESHTMSGGTELGAGRNQVAA